MKRTLLVLSTILGSMSFAQDCSDLFISEYVEGWSNNKALEIYNPTSNTVDLSQYMVIRYSNGATSATAANAIQLTGSIAPGDVYVAVLEKLDPLGTGQEAPIWDSLQARADGYYCPDYNTSNAFYWNGNDCIALAMGTPSDIAGSTLVDFFGKLGEDPDPGWTSVFPYVASGDVVTEDHSMIRKSNILQGQTNPLISYFDPLLEYDSIPAVVDILGLTYGNWFTLGSHTCDCGIAGVDQVNQTKVALFPNPTSGEFYINGATDYKSISIVNSLGQEVQKYSNNSTSLLTIDLGSRKGVYFVKLTANNGSTLTKRVILK